MFRSFVIALLLGLTSSSLFATSLAHYNSMLQPEDAKSDIRQWLSFIEKTHPDLAYTTKNIDDFHNRVNEFKNSIKEPISVRDFWLEMMKFNSVISDGHVSLTPSKSRELTKDYLKSGGSLFPFKVIFDNNQLVIKEKLNGEPSNIAGNTITRINGISINTILKPLLERTHGDSENQRRAVLATRFSSYYWLFFGENKQFQLDIKVGTHTINNITVEASNDITYYDESFESNFKFDVLNKDTGLLTINTFTWRQNESRVFEFLKSVFTRVKENNLTHLMIDIRENGGGDDNIWKQGILPYIADKAWKHGSDYKVKILAGREDEGETAGDVVSGVLTNMTAADINNPLKFTGDVSVLVGPYTYSSSILFMNVIQDYEFGKLVGDKTGGKSGQTGGTQHLTLTHSNLHSVVPRFLLTRPKGGRNLELVTLDTIIKYDPMKPTQLIEKLLIN